MSVMSEAEVSFVAFRKRPPTRAFFCFLELIPKWSLKGNMNSWPKIPYYNSNTCVLELLQPETKHWTLPRFSLVPMCAYDPSKRTQWRWKKQKSVTIWKLPSVLFLIHSKNKKKNPLHIQYIVAKLKIPPETNLRKTSVTCKAIMNLEHLIHTIFYIEKEKWAML